MIVCVRIPWFRLSAALRRAVSPHESAFLIDRPLRGRVVEATDPVLAAGVRVGMDARQALRWVPFGRMVLDEPAAAALRWDAVLALLCTVAPVEDGGLGRAFLRLDEDEEEPVRWFEPVRDALRPSGLPVCLGAAVNRFVAQVATYRGGGGAVCPPGREATFVADAPLERLELDEDALLRLRLLGVRTLADFTLLPPSYLERFGPEAARWFALAHGIDDPGVTVRRVPPRLRAVHKGR